MSPNSNDATLGEVARRLDDVFNRYEQIANDLPKTFVSREVFMSAKELSMEQRESLRILIAAQEKRIQQLEDDKTWLYRLVIGAVILAILGVVTSVTLAQKGSGPKSLGPPISVVSMT